MSRLLLDSLRPDAILLDAPALTSTDVITLLAEKLEALGLVHPSYGPAAIKREATMPTGLPLGEINVAIPHTDVVHVVKAGVALAVLAAPVAFANMDEPEEHLPVRIVFALALTDKHAQIAMLQAIMGFIQDEAGLRRLLGARTPQQALAAISGEIQPDETGETT